MLPIYSEQHVYTDNANTPLDNIFFKPDHLKTIQH